MYTTLASCIIILVALVLDIGFRLDSKKETLDQKDLKKILDIHGVKDSKVASNPETIFVCSPEELGLPKNLD